MTTTSTFNDLLNYAYNESGLLESDRVQRIIDGDPIVADEYRELTDLLDDLNQAVPPVPAKAVNNILAYAAKA